MRDVGTAHPTIVRLWTAVGVPGGIMTIHISTITLIKFFAAVSLGELAALGFSIHAERKGILGYWACVLSPAIVLVYVLFFMGG